MKAPKAADFKVHAPVWVKLGSYPWWPARVAPDTSGVVHKAKKVHVIFFGDDTESWVDVKKIRVFDDAPQQGKGGKGVAEALEEAHQWIAAGPPALGRSMHDGTSTVFVRQADKQLYHKSQRPGHNGTRFEPDFELMRGAFAAGPALVQKASGLLEVLMQGVDRQVYHSAQTERGAFLGFGSFNALGGRTRQFAC